MFILGCPPPHVNSLDPESSNYVPPTASCAPEDFVCRVHTLHTLRTFPQAEFYSVLVEAWPINLVSLDTVYISYLNWPAEGLRRSTNGLWMARFQSSYFNDPRLGTVIGREFTFTLNVADDGVCVVGPVYAFRVIVNSPELIRPINNEVTVPFPSLEWETFDVEFPFEYLVEVLMIDVEHQFEVVVWTSDRIPRTATQQTVSDSLIDGVYYWTLSAIDPFENESRSREGFFAVQGNTQP